MVNARQKRRAETRRQQREATPKLHPRGLARSVKKAMGAGKKEWRSAIAAMPKTGQRYLHPERRKGA